MTLRLPSLAVFDLAGTTIQDDGTVAAVFKEVLAAEGIWPTSEEIAQVRGAAKREAFQRLSREAVQAKRLYEHFIEGIRQRYTTSPPREVPGTSNTFTWLRQQGAKLALNTGFERETVGMLLSALGWDADCDRCHRLWRRGGRRASRTRDDPRSHAQDGISDPS